MLESSNLRLWFVTIHTPAGCHAKAGRMLHERKGTVMALEEPIIRLRNVGKEFKTANGPVVALEDINLDIERGEIFGIIGFVAPILLFVGTCFALSNQGNPIAALKLGVFTGQDIKDLPQGKKIYRICRKYRLLPR